jgi:hypothetical protein
MHTDLQAITESSRLVTLSTKVAQVLDRLPGREPSSVDKQVLERGADLLSGILSGSLLVSGQKTLNGVHASHRGLHLYGSAVSAVRALKLLTEAEPDVTKLFIQFRSQLQTTAATGTLPADRGRLVSFFDTLSRLFERDIDAATVSRRRPTSIAR